MDVEAHLHNGKLLQSRYRIERLLGKGGFGVVYLAHDARMDRKVALKFVYRQLNIEYLRAEVAVLARHAEKLKFIPNVYDHWEQKSQGAGYYIVMEFIEGETLDRIRTIPWNSDAVINFLQILLRNLHDLHSRQIIHCDIKPVNIKELPPSGLSYHVPYMILDFGIAKQGNITTLRGTSEYYASPEQYGKGGSNIKLDPRADLYGLAATAYHLLTGKMPIDAATRYTNAFELGLGDTLPRPSSIVANVPPALEQTILDMLQLNREQRPANAETALHVLEQRLSGASQAPTGSKQQAQVQSLTEVVALVPTPAPIAAPATPAPWLTEITRERRPPQQVSPAPDLVAALQSSLLPAVDSSDVATFAQVACHSNGTITDLAWSPKADRLLVGSTLGVFEYRLDQPTQLALCYPTPAPVRRIGYLLGGSAVAVATGSRIVVLSPACDQVLRELAGPTPQAPNDVLIAPQGSTIAIVADRELTLYSADTGTPSGEWQLPEQLVERRVTMSVDGRSLAICADGRLHSWTVQTDLRGQHWNSINLPRPHVDLALAGNGDIAVAAPTQIAVWNRESQTTQLLDHPTELIQRVVLSSDGRTIALATDRSVIIQRVRDGKILQTLAHAQRSAIHSLAFSPDDRLIAAASGEAITIWRVRDGTHEATIDGFTGSIQSLVTLPDGQTLANVAYALVVQGFDGARFTEASTSERLHEPGVAIAANAAGNLLAVATTNEVQLWELDKQEQVQAWPSVAAQTHCVCFSANDTRLFVIGEDGVAAIDLASGVPTDLLLAEQNSVDHIAFAAQGNKIATHSTGRVAVQLLESAAESYSFEPFANQEVCALALSPDGTHLAIATPEALACWWIGDDDPQLITQQPLVRQANAHHILFSHRNNLLVVLHGHIADVWQLADDVLQHVGVARGHTDRINDADISADGLHLFTGSQDGTLRVWRL